MQFNEFREKLTAVSLPVGMSIDEAHETPKFAHFLTSGIASVITSMKDGGLRRDRYVGQGRAGGVHAPRLQRSCP